MSRAFRYRGDVPQTFGSLCIEDVFHRFWSPSDKEKMFHNYRSLQIKRRRCSTDIGVFVYREGEFSTDVKGLLT